jgi:transposase
MPANKTAQNTHRQYQRQGHQQNAGLRLPPWDPPVNPIHPLFGVARSDEDLPRWVKPPRISRETKRLMLLAYCRDKKSTRLIAEEFGVNRATVEKAFAGYRGARPISLYKVRRIYTLKHEENMSPTQIAKRVGCSRSTVEKYLQLEHPVDRWVQPI